MRAAAIFVIAFLAFAYQVSAQVKCLNSGSSCRDKVVFCVDNPLQVLKQCNSIDECKNIRADAMDENGQLTRQEYAHHFHCRRRGTVPRIGG